LRNEPTEAVPARGIAGSPVTLARSGLAPPGPAQPRGPECPLTLPSPRRGEGLGATAEELQEEAEVAPVGLDGHRAEPLLHRAVLEEARVQGGQHHDVAGA